MGRWEIMRKLNVGMLATAIAGTMQLATHDKVAGYLLISIWLFGISIPLLGYAAMSKERETHEGVALTADVAFISGFGWLLTSLGICSLLARINQPLGGIVFVSGCVLFAKAFHDSESPTEDKSIQRGADRIDV